MKTNLAGFKRNCWRRNLSGYFTHNGKELTDAQVRKIVEYGIAHGYECDVDIPNEEIDELLKQ